MALSFQIMFEASVGSSYSGDIAIDDVLITDGACPLPGNKLCCLLSFFVLSMQ